MVEIDIYTDVENKRKISTVAVHICKYFIQPKIFACLRKRND